MLFYRPEFDEFWLIKYFLNDCLFGFGLVWFGFMANQPL